jgi:hypothetical protein
MSAAGRHTLQAGDTPMSALLDTFLSQRKVTDDRVSASMLTDITQTLSARSATAA